MMMDMEEDKYGEQAVKCAAETLVKAEEIKKDPKLLALVKAEMDKTVGAIKSIKELRKVAAAKMKEPEPDAKDAVESLEEEIPPELMTEEDKHAKQRDMKYDKRSKELGFKVKK